MVFYYPEKERQANLIGQFDRGTIQDHEDRFLKGKLAGWKPQTAHTKMKMEEKDCSIGLTESGESSDLDDEILREIMAEEEERRKQAEEEAEEEAKKAKKKKKGKKDKKGKKGKKAS